MSINAIGRDAEAENINSDKDAKQFHNKITDKYRKKY